MAPKSRPLKSEPAQQQGRITIPMDMDTWIGLVRARGLEHHRLGQITSHHDPSKQRFSGSCLPDNAFLQLRALWPPSKPDWHAAKELQSAGFFTEDELDRAQAVLGRDDPYRGLAKVHKLIDYLDKTKSKEGEPPRTPERAQARWLGGEWEAMSQARRKFFDLPPSRPDTDHISSPRVVIESMYTPEAVPFDVTKDPDPGTPLELSDSDLDPSSWNLCSLSLDDTPSKRYNAREGEPATTRGPETAGGATHIAPPRPPPRDPTYDYSNWRTPYEVQTSHFFDTFISGFIDQAFLSDCGIGVKFQERRYKFKAAQGPVLFTASPDAVFSHCKGAPFALVEIKPFRRTTDVERAIHIEETAEMAAFLSEEVSQASSKAKGTSGKFNHRLIISFDRDEFWFVLARFSDKYLEYIQDHNSPTMPLVETNSDYLEHMISFQRLGPFCLGESRAMDVFAQVLLANFFNRLKSRTESLDVYNTLVNEVRGAR